MNDGLLLSKEDQQTLINFYKEATLTDKMFYKLILEHSNIQLEYSWPGHREEWFFPTDEEIEIHWDYINEMREDG